MSWIIIWLILGVLGFLALRLDDQKDLQPKLVDWSSLLLLCLVSGPVALLLVMGFR